MRMSKIIGIRKWSVTQKKDGRIKNHVVYHLDLFEGDKMIREFNSNLPPSSELIIKYYFIISINEFPYDRRYLEMSFSGNIFHLSNRIKLDIQNWMIWSGAWQIYVFNKTLEYNKRKIEPLTKWHGLAHFEPRNLIMQTEIYFIDFYRKNIFNCCHFCLAVIYWYRGFKMEQS